MYNSWNKVFWKREHIQYSGFTSQSPRVETAQAYPALYGMKQLGLDRERQHRMKFLNVEGNNVMTGPSLECQ